MRVIPASLSLLLPLLLLTAHAALAAQAQVEADYGPPIKIDMGGGPAFTLYLAASCATPSSDGADELASSSACASYLMRVKAVCSAKGWLGVGIAGPSSSNAMIGGHAVAGFMDPDKPSVGLYALNFPSKQQVVLVPGSLDANGIHDASFVVGSLQSTLEFVWEQKRASKYMNLVPNPAGGSDAADNTVKMIFAQGGPNSLAFSYHEYRVPQSINLLKGAASEPDVLVMESALAAHCALAMLAFGLLLPFGGATALLRPWSTWLEIHTMLQIAGALTGLGAWISAVVHVNRAGSEAFSNAHEIFGTIVVFTSLAQLLNGFLKHQAPRRRWLPSHRFLAAVVLLGGGINILLGAQVFKTNFLHGETMFRVGSTSYRGKHFTDLARLLGGLVIVSGIACALFAQLKGRMVALRRSSTVQDPLLGSTAATT